MKQQVLNNYMSHWLVTPTFWCASNLLTFIFMLLLALGYFLFNEAEKLNSFEIRYDEECKYLRGKDKTCNLTFTLDESLDNPKVYYRLTEFYQNHRSF
jgi:hypothetical protein